jgi:uncharacterized damage-inducible protein DinB
MRPRSATRPPDALRDSVLSAWSTSNLTTIYLVERLPDPVWTAALPGSPRRTVRMLAGHLHNSRCMWLKTLGRPHGIPVPRSVDRRKVSRKELVVALNRSSLGIADLLVLGLERGGTIPATRRTVEEPASDVGHVLAHFVAHEGHHRGRSHGRAALGTAAGGGDGRSVAMGATRSRPIERARPPSWPAEIGSPP